jgi:hypothetical protein
VAGPDAKVINEKIRPMAELLEIARVLVVQIRAKLDIGAANLPTSKAPQIDCVVRLRTLTWPWIENPQSFFKTTRDIREMADRALIARCGNCAENSAIAFTRLVDYKIEPLDYMELAGPGDDHAFVVIGRREGSSEKKYDAPTWGPDAVVCDPWMNKAYPCKEMGIHLASRTSTFLYRSMCRYRTINGFPQR